MTIAVIASAMAILSVLHSDTDNSSAEVVESGWCGENAYYHIYSDGTLLIDGSGAMYDYSGLSRAPWYEHHDGITKIVIGDNITHLGQWAFVKCKHVKELTIPITLNSVTVDTSCAFASCYNIEKINFTVGVDGYGFDYAAYLGNNAWYQLTPWYQSKDVLKEIHFADGITHIGADAFRELNITSIVLPDSVTSLGCHCFYSCTKLIDLTIPVSLNPYGNEDYPAFQGCTWITKFTFTKGNGVPFDYSNFWGEKNSDLAPWNNTPFLLKNIIISDDVQSLGKYMFHRCLIKELTLPISAECGSSKAFVCDDSYGYYYLLKVTITKGNGSGCNYSESAALDYNPWNMAPNLDALIVEEGVSHIGDYTFYHCRVQTVILPNTFETVGKCAFGDCNIKYLTVPISFNAVSLDEYPAFDGISGLTKVTFTAGNGNGCNYSAHSYDPNWYQNTPWYKCKSTLEEIVFEDGIKRIGADAFRELNLIYIVIPDSVESLGCHAFCQCRELKLITLPISLDSVHSAEYPAFEGCTSIAGVRLTAGTGVGVDYGTDVLPIWCIQSVIEISIASGISYIGDHTFDGYTFFGKDGKKLEPVSADLSGHLFLVKIDHEMHQGDCESESVIPAVVPTPALAAFFIWRC